MVADLLELPFDHIRKNRIDARTVEMETAHINVDGKRVALIDDIISTGGTMIKAATALKESGAVSVVGIASHGMFSDDDLSRLRAGLDGLAVTNSLDTPASSIDISKELYDLLTH